jgi:hypothetical protein
MRILGPIIRLQIQRSPLKIGEKPNRRYDPAPILSVPRLRITTDGAYGLENGHEIVDVHNRLHPQTRQENPENALSFGFTGHYAEMRNRFGEHMALGCAGENVIVEVNRRIALESVKDGVVILGADETEKLRLAQIRVAAPCKPFSGFALRHQLVEPAVLKATLQFLDDGTRGFYSVPQVRQAVELQLGDLLALA